MKKFFALLFGLLCGHACWANYTPQYESYTTYAIDDNDDLSQTVVLDGTTTGDCYHPCNCGQYGCQQCSIPNCPADHTPQINNVLGGAGGWSYGQATGMFNYVSYQTTVTIVADGQQYLTSTEGAIFCAVAAGYIFDVGSSGKTVYLTGNSCLDDPTYNYGGIWGDVNGPGCTIADNFALPQGGSCVTGSTTRWGTTKRCYQITVNNCQQTFCTVDTRVVDPDCLFFRDGNGYTLTRASLVPGACN